MNNNDNLDLAMILFVWLCVFSYSYITNNYIILDGMIWQDTE